MYEVQSRPYQPSKNNVSAESQFVPGTWLSSIIAADEEKEMCHVIDGLRHNSIYEIRVVPVRLIGTHRGSGSASNKVVIRTHCKGNNA